MPQRVLQWIEPFKRSRFEKPPEWTEKLRPLTDDVPVAETADPVGEAIARTQYALLSRQNRQDGYWCYEILGGDVMTEADTIMLLNFLGQGDSPKVPKLAKTILQAQLEDGGWPVYRNGPAEISETVKAYWALKFAGYKTDHPALEKARLRIKELGGIHKVNTYTKFYLAVFDLYDWEGIPSIPPEIMLFPRWFPFNIYEMSSWTRAIVIPLSIIWSERPKIDCPAHARLDELFNNGERHIPLKDAMPPHGIFSWTSFFLWCDKFLKVAEGRGPHWLRTWGLQLAENWILARLRDSDGLGAIYPGIINTIMAMKCLNYSESDPVFKDQLKHLEDLETETADGLRILPCHSPTWDTGIAMISLAESGLSAQSLSFRRATEWLLSQEIRQPGDWCRKNNAGPIGGWAFEFNNAFYPDIDDTAMIMLALRHVELDPKLSHARELACQRGLHWLLSMQSNNGGWAAFDKNNSQEVLTKVPFAGHNAMIDPPTADITGRVLEFLGHIGYDQDYACVSSAIEFLQRHQESDGSWYGRWCVNYLYGTWQVIRGMTAVGVPTSDPCVRRAAEWLLSVQLPEGGWGETCETYQNPSLKGTGPATPSQTAWALMGLMAAGMGGHPAIQRGVEYLLSIQRRDGTWDETQCTGTGFPGVFYLTYRLYRDAFPLMALGIYQKLRAEPVPTA